MTNLHPVGAGATISFGSHTYGLQQVGAAGVGGALHASLWNSTAASWLDLNPGGAGSTESWASGVTGTQQSGYAIIGGMKRVGVWSGTAASWFSLHPASATESQAYRVFGTQQVGNAVVGGVTQASLWSGTPESWVDLSAFLTGSWGLTHLERRHIVVAGFNNATGRNEALLLTRCYANCDSNGAITIDTSSASRRSLPWAILVGGPTATATAA